MTNESSPHASTGDSARQPSPGERWAYRARAGDPLVEVEVLKLGVKRPPRVFVGYVDDAFEGLKEWVPPARLKVPWREVSAFIDREERWDRVIASCPPQDSPEEGAASQVFDILIDPSLAWLEYKADGVARVADVAGLAARLDIEPEILESDPTSFMEDGDLIAPWPVTRMLAKRAAELEPDPILLWVHRDENEARRDAIYGRHYGGRGKNGGWDVSPEICAQVDEEHGKPVRTLLREWCGAEAVGLREELETVRKEVARLTALIETAVEDLRRANARGEAERLAAELRGESMGTQPRRTAHGTARGLREA